jgi:hypothetical protein
MLPEGRDEEQARACPSFHHRPIKVEGPALNLNLQRGHLRIRPFGHEIREDLGFNCVARRVSERLTHELHELFGDLARCVRVTYDIPQWERADHRDQVGLEVMKEVASWSDSFILIWWYPE